MTRLEALQALAEKVEARTIIGTRCFAKVFGLQSDNRHLSAWSAYNGSLDAAKGLQEKVLPGWDADLTLSGGATVFRTLRIEGFDAFVPNKLARAWLLAILKALIAQEQAKGDE